MSSVRLDTYMTTPGVAFVPASLALRPPRVAILFPDDQLWREWVMTALATASDYWGGGGFILVPYNRETREPSAQFAEVVRAYDPDHVVTLEIRAQEYEAWYPGSISFSNVADEEQRLALIRRMHHEMNDPAGLHARETVVSWCSPMRSVRMARDEQVRQMETVTNLRRADRSDRYARGLPTAPIGTHSSRVAASASWRSDAGLFSALRVGVANEEPHERSEPGAEVFDWLIAPTSDAPTALIWSNEVEPPASSSGMDWWFLADQRLMQVSRGYLRDRAAVVVGDTGTDFALALAYDRIIGRGMWLTPTLLEDDAWKQYVRPAIWRTISDLERGAHHIAVSSTSLTQKQLAKISDRLHEPEFTFQHVAEKGTVQARFAEVERGFLDYVVNEHVGTSVVLPMSVLEDGTRDAMTGLESPVPSDLLYPNDLGKLPYWYVDVTLSDDHAPRGRDLPAAALMTIEEGTFPEVNLRPSKDGVTYDPTSMGFVAGGTLLPGRIGRPRLRALSVRAWVEGMAEAAGLGVRLSTPGRHAELVRRRLGSRNQLLDLIAGPALPMLRAFIPRQAAPKKRDTDTIVLGLDPYLSFAAIDALLPGPEDATLAVIDALASARLLRRGLILGCLECGRPSFLDADKLGQQYECPQCATMNTLVSERWRKGTEPTWFYDLFATFRELLARNGDVPLLAAAQLRATGRAYADTPELEFFELDTKAQVAEVDLIASVSREVVLVEAKVNGEFKSGTRGDQTQKLLRVAEALRADRLVLATKEDHWKQTDIDHVTREAAKASPFPLETEVLAGLGASESGTSVSS